MTVDGVHDGTDGPLGMFPTEVPWTPEAGFVVEQPPAQLDDAWARTVAKLQAASADET